MDYIAIRNNFCERLKQFFDEHPFNDKKFFLTRVQNRDGTYASHSYIFYEDGLMINVRVGKYGALNDVSAYIDHPQSKYIFDELLMQKNAIEQEIGYELVWDRNDRPGLKDLTKPRTTTRIGKFGKFSRDKNKNGLERGHTFVETYDFDFDVQQVALALVKFYYAFVPRFYRILRTL